MLLGLKASTDERQIRDRLQYHPDVFEFHLTEADFTASGWQHFLKMVAWVQSQVPTVVFHHPMRFRGQRNELAMNPTKYPARYDFLTAWTPPEIMPDGVTLQKHKMWHWLA